MEERKRLMERAKKNWLEIRQLFWDTEHWNNHHAKEPINIDPDGLLGRLARGLSYSFSSEFACPTCGSKKFQKGPSAGLSVNVRCENEHYWNLSPLGLEPILRSGEAVAPVRP